MFKKPLQTSPLLSKDRTRLRYLVPLSDLTFALNIYSGSELSRQDKIYIENLFGLIIDQSNSIFSQDIIDILLFRQSMGSYVIDQKNKLPLARRLSISYTDGSEFNYISKRVASTNILDEETTTSLLETDYKASITKNESKSLGDEIGLSVGLIPPFTLP